MNRRPATLAVLAALGAAGLPACTTSGFNTKVELREPAVHDTPHGTTYQDLALGSGLPAVHGSLVVLHYVGWVQGGQRFDSSYERGIPERFTLGASQAIAAFDEGLMGMRPGGRRRLIVPPDQAYGAEGVPGLVPPSATLVLEVEMLQVAGP